MSMVKRLMEAKEDLRNIALGLLCETGALEKCKYHDSSYFDGGALSLEETYKLANAKVTRGEVELPDGMNRRDLTDAIKDAWTDNAGPDTCPICENIFSKD